MRTDVYTKVMPILPAVQAQNEPAHVILARWSQSPTGADMSFGRQPLPIGGLNGYGIAPILVRQQR